MDSTFQEVRQLVHKLVEMKRAGNVKPAQVEEALPETTAVLAIRTHQRGTLRQLEGFREANARSREALDATKMKNFNLCMRFSLDQRQFATELVEEKKKDKERASAELNTRKELSNSILGKVQTIQSSMRDVPSLLNIQGPSGSSKDSQEKVANTLPAPLYVLYRQLHAYISTFEDPSSITVSWRSPEAAAAWKSQATQDYAADPSYGADGATGRESKRRRIEAVEAVASDSEQLYNTAPFLVELEIRPLGSEPGTPGIRIQFEYLDRLNLVAARAPAEADRPLLVELGLGDDGCEVPDEDLRAVLPGGFDASRAARPYVWCQQLGGIDLLPSSNPFAAGQPDGKAAAVFDSLILKYRQEARAANTLHLIRARREAVLRQAALIDRLKVARSRPTRVRPADLLGAEAAAGVSSSLASAPGTLRDFFRTTSHSRRGPGVRPQGGWDAPIDVYRCAIDLPAPGGAAALPAAPPATKGKAGKAAAGAKPATVALEFELSVDTALAQRPSVKITKLEGLPVEDFGDLARRATEEAEGAGSSGQGREGESVALLLASLASVASEMLVARAEEGARAQSPGPGAAAPGGASGPAADAPDSNDAM